MPDKPKPMSVKIDTEWIALGLGFLAMWTALVALGGYLAGYEPFPCMQRAYERCVFHASRAGDLEQLQRCESFKEVKT